MFTFLIWEDFHILCLVDWTLKGLHSGVRVRIVVVVHCGTMGFGMGLGGMVGIFFSVMDCGKETRGGEKWEGSEFRKFERYHDSVFEFNVLNKKKIIRELLEILIFLLMFYLIIIKPLLKIKFPQNYWFFFFFFYLYFGFN